jgi:hypothetical protein
MSSDRTGPQPKWQFAGASPEGLSFAVGGLDVWKHRWLDTRERAQVVDPHYQRELTFDVYEIRVADKVITFAAGEFSNGIWGFYVIGEMDFSPQQ